MKINQLFKSLIPDDLLSQIIVSYGFESIKDHQYSFCKNDLERLLTLEKINNLKEEISKYYLPCKAKIYLENLDINKCITLLRQILRMHGDILETKQKYIKNKKTTIYFIRKEKEDDKKIHNIKIDNNSRTIEF